MGYNHQTFSTSEIAGIIRTLDEYKLPYKLIKVPTREAGIRFSGTRILITQEYVYIDCFRDDPDCDGTSEYFSEKFERKKLFKSPKAVTIYEYLERDGLKINLNTKDYNWYIDPKFDLYNQVDDTEEDIKESAANYRSLPDRISPDANYSEEGKVNKICKAYLKNNCTFKERCKFSHNTKDIPCRWFENGDCRFGDYCKFKHAG